MLISWIHRQAEGVIGAKDCKFVQDLKVDYAVQKLTDGSQFGVV